MTTAHKAAAPTITTMAPMMSQYSRSARIACLNEPEPPQTMSGMISVIKKMAPKVLTAVQR